MKQKCSYADKYKGKRKPTCGCLKCDIIWTNNISRGGLEMAPAQAHNLYDGGSSPPYATR